MKRAQTQGITMAIGVIVAVAIVCSQFFYLPQASVSKKDTATEQHETEHSDDDISFSVPSTSLPSSAHVELNPHIFFLFEILYTESVQNVPPFKIAIPLGQFFRTVFGLTISPNAP